MRDAAGKDVGDRIALSVEHDPTPRREPMQPAFRRALAATPEARRAFAALPASRQKEILAT